MKTSGRTDGRDKRREPRCLVECKATARIALCLDVLDASLSGVRVRCGIKLPLGTTLKIKLPGGSERHAKVAWTEHDLIGCEFLAPIDKKELSKIMTATPAAPPSSEEQSKKRAAAG